MSPRGQEIMNSASMAHQGSTSECLSSSVSLLLGIRWAEVMICDYTSSLSSSPIQKVWTQSYYNIFSVDLRYAGILALWLAKNGYLTFISQ